MFHVSATGSYYGTNSNAIGNMATQSAFGFNQFNVNNVSEVRNTYGLHGDQYSISSRGSNSSFDSSSIASSEGSISHNLSAVSGCDESFSSENGSMGSDSMHNVIYSSQTRIEQIQQTVEQTVQYTHEVRITANNPDRAKPSEDIPVPKSGLKLHFTGKLKSNFCCLMPYLTSRKYSR